MGSGKATGKRNLRRLFEALPQASDADLVRLRVAIDRILLDPERVAAIRRELRVGQRIDYLSERHHRVNRGRVVELMPDRVLIETEDQMLRWLHYASVQIGPVTSDDGDAPPRPELPFGAGDAVSYDDAGGVHRIGVVRRVNPKTATVVTDGVPVRVLHAAVRRVVDI